MLSIFSLYHVCDLQATQNLIRTVVIHSKPIKLKSLKMTYFLFVGRFISSATEKEKSPEVCNSIRHMKKRNWSNLKTFGSVEVLQHFYGNPFLSRQKKGRIWYCYSCCGFGLANYTVTNRSLNYCPVLISLFVFIKWRHLERYRHACLKFHFNYFISTFRYLFKKSYKLW